MNLQIIDFLFKKRLHLLKIVNKFDVLKKQIGNNISYIKKIVFVKKKRYNQSHLVKKKQN